jgi:hypothetical protein
MGAMIFFPMIWFAVFFGGWGLLFFIVHGIGKALKRSAWLVTTKRAVYAVSVALLVTPLFPLPIPSAALIVAFILTPTTVVANRMWVFAPCFAVTLAVCWLIARRKFIDPSDQQAPV